MFCETIQRKRINKGLTQTSLAKLVGVSSQFIQQIESGKKTPSLSNSVKIAAALGCTVDELLALPNEDKLAYFKT